MIKTVKSDWSNSLEVNTLPGGKQNPVWYPQGEPDMWQRGYVSIIDSLLDCLATPVEIAWENDPPSDASHSEQEYATRSSHEDGFERQKQAFMNIPLDSLAPYRGKFVASRNGIIVDNDTNLVALTHRVRENYGDLPMYITRFGKPVKMPTPFVR